MRFTNGYSKLGPNVVTVNRPVGHSCPVACPFHPESKSHLKNKCYMVRLEGMRPNIRKSAMQNMESNPIELAEMLWEARAKKQLVRMHVGGDFFKEGKLDKDYLIAWSRALSSMYNPPPVVCYTHVTVHGPMVVDILSLYPQVKLFASVHTKLGLKQARGNGFTRFAIAMEEKHYQWDGGAWVERFGIKALVCPEQRGKIKDCGTCQYCWKDWKHGGHVAFLEHSQPNRKKKVD